MATGGLCAILLCAAALPLALAQPTIGQVNASASRSLVRIQRTDAAGVTDSLLGFVIGPNQVATGFQAIDAPQKIEVIFADGRKVAVRDVWACNRLKDWAIVRADTGSIPALAKAEKEEIAAGQRFLAFRVDAGGKPALADVEIAGRSTVPIFGDRIQFSAQPSKESVGGPLLTPAGLVAGIIGGSRVPGSRLIYPAGVEATPITGVTVPNGGKAVRLEVLIDSGLLTPPLTLMRSLVSCGVARSFTKGPNSFTADDVSEFSRTDNVARIYSLWQKKDKGGSGEAAARIYDVRNKVLVDFTPQNLSIPESAPALVDFRAALQKYPPGVYRVDVLWNDQPVCRKFFAIAP